VQLRDIERKVIVSSRYLTVTAVFGSLAGSVLMFFLGLYNIYRAFTEGLALPEDEEDSFGANAVISVIEGLDRFLIAIVLLYFAYGVYTLFLHPEKTEKALALPEWLQVKEIGQLKQVVAEVIIVVLFVLFLRMALQVFHDSHTTMEPMTLATMMALPVSILLLAIALRLVQLHPKPTAEERAATHREGAKDDVPPGEERD
jgi:uncharacterized membrane protein YqhA